MSVSETCPENKLALNKELDRSTSMEHSSNCCPEYRSCHGISHWMQAFYLVKVLCSLWW